MDKSTGSKKPKPSFEEKNLKTKNPGSSLRKGTGQAAPAPPTLRYGPTGDSTPPLRLKRLAWPKGSLSARPHSPNARL